MAKVLKTATGNLKDRVPLVQAGHQQCVKGGCAVGSDRWEIHNTVSHDGMIISLMDHLSRIIESSHLDRDRLKEIMESISIDITQDRSLTFYDIYQNRSWLSPHPDDSIDARWGLQKCDMILSYIRTAKECIAFIESIYDRRDPRYANFTIREQQEIIRKLNEELMNSGCNVVTSARR